MQKYTFSEVMTNPKKQREFLKQIDRIIAYARKYGYVEAVIAYSENRKMLVEAIELFSPAKEETIAIIHADYEEYQPETFRGYTVNRNGRFQTLDEAVEYAASIADRVMTSSTVDNYEYDLDDQRKKAHRSRNSTSAVIH
ncbi:hypothetical protein [Pararhizobium qamdonense]|uniref:hypothetical protein n=1 Tax=Pararhizobium qamdonense TaxID=3031126 RepID=UPI0023E345E4|nr:hypothetical protein [Pararhizobium qamdonense]